MVSASLVAPLFSKLAKSADPDATRSAGEKVALRPAVLIV